MAVSASGGSVSADMKPVDYRGAVKRLETIDTKKTKQQKFAKEIGDVYSACEGICGVDKTASKVFMALRKLDTNDLRTTFRDLNGLLDASGIMEESADLVDSAEDKSVRQRFTVHNGGRGNDAEDDDGDSIDDEIDELTGDGSGEALPSVDDDAFTEASEEELAQQRGRTEAKEARAVRGAGAKKADPEPYTGDNSDLADAAE